MRAICFKCGKAIVVCRENSSALTVQYRFREHGPVSSRCIGSRNRYFFHELALVPVRK